MVLPAANHDPLNPVEGGGIGGWIVDSYQALSSGPPVPVDKTGSAFSLNPLAAQKLRKNHFEPFAALFAGRNFRRKKFVQGLFFVKPATKTAWNLSALYSPLKGG